MHCLYRTIFPVGPAPRQVGTETAEKFLTRIGRRPLAARCGTHLVQVGTEMVEKFPARIGGRTCILPLALPVI